VRESVRLPLQAVSTRLSKTDQDAGVRKHEFADDIVNADGESPSDCSKDAQFNQAEKKKTLSKKHLVNRLNINFRAAP
jgi:hypothetical protein